MSSTARLRFLTFIAFFFIALAFGAFITFPPKSDERDTFPDVTAAAQAPATTPAASSKERSSVYGDAAALAMALPLGSAEEAIPEYSRSAFGPAWADIDGNGCRQRDDVLARDLVDVELAANNCTVIRGVLEDDPYTGKRIIFQHDRVADEGNPGSQGVQGEHIVSLKAAHVGGAWSWTDERRLRFANDLNNVIAVDGIANQSKQDAGPADWLPMTDYRCTYVTRYTQIATEWDLAVSRADRDALVTTLNECAVSE